MSARPVAARPATVSAEQAVLDVRGLSVSIGRHDLLHDLTFSIGRGERVGLIGESGSGKSLTSLALLGLLPEGARVSGSVRLAGVEHDVVGAGERAMAAVRGNDVSMVFQEPMTALNPTMRVGAQVAETILIHAGRRGRPGAARGAVRERVATLLDHVGLPAPTEIARAYPHQLSGGQRQRVVVAIALANDPALLVCDEPTTALDVTVQAKVLDLIVRGVEARNAAMLFITHDLPVVATVCERVLVMYGGRIVEAGPVAEVFTRPRHRYTEGLLGASDLEGTLPGKPLETIPGSVPPAGAFPEGCVFRTRCAHATAECAVVPPWTSERTAHGYACVHPAGGGR
ncbi:ABC transporter ATP-binding protein [Intrasporangium sp. DVR]|uniref:ABC transporter ATP-binding protein n=1 Tax=Intrasporangium sp. DVR TaxID=3127867 RepID=UPI00313A7082